MSGPARFLLRVRLLSASPDLGAGEGRGCAAALVLEVRDDSSVDDGARGLRRRRLEVEVGLADFFAGEGEDWQSGELGGDGESWCGEGVGSEGYEGFDGLAVRGGGGEEE